MLYTPYSPALHILLFQETQTQNHGFIMWDLNLREFLQKILTHRLCFKQPCCIMLAVLTKIPGLPCGFKIAFTHSVVKNWYRNCRVTLTAISYVVLSDSSPQSYQLQKLSHVQPLQRPRQYL